MEWFRQAAGPSRISENGHAWKIRQALTQAHFNKFDREATFRIATEYATSTLQELITQTARGETLDDNRLRIMTAAILIENFFEVKLSSTPIELSAISDIMNLISEYSFYAPGRTAELDRNALLSLMEARRKVLDQLGYIRTLSEPRSPLLEDMIAADCRDEDRIIIEQELLTFLAAGSESSAATVGWACYLLALNPDIQDQLRAICTAFWQSKNPSWKSLATLEPLAAFVSEALRLFPPTPIAARLAVDKDKLGDIEIEPKQSIAVSFIGIQHDKRFHPSPWSVNLEAALRSPTAGSTMSFGIGPRVCGGKNFALVELLTILSIFLYRARLTLTSDTPPSFLWKSQMLREGGQPVRVDWIDGAGRDDRSEDLHRTPQSSLFRQKTNDSRSALATLKPLRTRWTTRPLARPGSASTARPAIWNNPFPMHASKIWLTQPVGV